MSNEEQDTEKPKNGLKYIGEGIAFAALCGSAAWLEINGYPAAGLWVLVVIWALNF